MADPTPRPGRKPRKAARKTVVVPPAALDMNIPAALAAPQPVSIPAAPIEPTGAQPAIPPAAARAAPAAPAAKDIAMDTIDTATSTAGHAAEGMAARAETLFASAGDRARGAMEKGQQMMQEAADFGRGNLEALVESSRIAAQGFEAFGRDSVAYAKKSFDEATAAAKQIATVKSPTELLKLQSDYARNAFDSLVAESSARAEAMLKLAGEIAQPVSNRVALAAEKMKIAA
jgi:phasin family protein